MGEVGSTLMEFFDYYVGTLEVEAKKLNLSARYVFVKFAAQTRLLHPKYELILSRFRKSERKTRHKYFMQIQWLSSQTGISKVTRDFITSLVNTHLMQYGV